MWRFLLEQPGWCLKRTRRCEDYYGIGIFDRTDFAKLRDILAGISGRFIRSINDVEHIRELFDGFRIETVKTSYSASGANKKKQVNELLIMSRFIN